MSQLPFTQAIAPSNIAFLKYWGKRDGVMQWPAEDSLSMTLAVATTTTRAYFSADGQDSIELVGLDDTNSKGLKHLAFLRKEVGGGAYLKLHSSNNFPASCGIASSASGFAALTLAAIAAWTRSSNFRDLEKAGFPRERLAHLARLGSGSAGRSLWGGFVHWEAGPAPTLQKLHPCFAANHWPLSDLIIVVSDQKKPVSSSEAHGSAWTSPLFAPRLAGLHERRDAMLAAIADRNLSALGPLIENEALEMHSVMMTSKPSANFWTKETEEMLVWIRQQRAHHQMNAWFTIDAGPNIHLICSSERADKYQTMIAEAFPHVQIIRDEVGNGPQLEGYFPK